MAKRSTWSRGVYSDKVVPILNFFVTLLRELEVMQIATQREQGWFWLERKMNRGLSRTLFVGRCQCVINDFDDTYLKDDT